MFGPHRPAHLLRREVRDMTFAQFWPCGFGARHGSPPALRAGGDGQADAAQT